MAVTNRYYVEWDDIEQEWCVWRKDAIDEDGEFSDVILAIAFAQEEANFICDALESFPEDIDCYHD